MCVDNQLPSHYTYLQENYTNDLFVVRIKEVVDQPSAEIWVQKFSESTGTAWRIARTYPYSGRKNIFKIDMRCIHLTDRRAKGIGPSKHTGCAAKLQLVVKKFYKNSVSKKPDVLVKDFPTKVTLKGKHNHKIVPEASLKQSKKCEEDQNPSFVTLSGETNFIIEYDGVFYETIAAEPNTISSDMHEVLLQNFPNAYDIIDEPNIEMDTCSQEQTLCEINSKETIVLDQTELKNNSEMQPVNSLTSKEYQEFESIFTRIKDGLQNNPELFVPAARQLLENTAKFATTETGLAASMHAFGTGYLLVNQDDTQNAPRRFNKTSSSIRKRGPAVKKRRNFWQTTDSSSKSFISLAGHDYATLNVPTHSMIKTHNSQFCVNSN